MISLSIFGNYDYCYFDGAVVVVFSNNTPPTYILYKDKWQIYKIKYNNEGISYLKGMDIKECTELYNKHEETLKSRVLAYIN